MALIIDANRAGDFSSEQRGHAVYILRCIEEKKLKVAVGGRLLRELGSTCLRDLLSEWGRAGILDRLQNSEVDAEEERCRKKGLRSDDPHVIAVALLSNARLLYTEDEYLIDDFKNINFLRPKGKIFKTGTKEKIVRALVRQYGI